MADLFGAFHSASSCIFLSTSMKKYEKVSSYYAEDIFKNCIYSNVLVIPY